MPQKKYILIILLLITQKVTAQNLVTNPGFESVISCNETFIHSSIENTANWFNAVEPLSTVDWYSNCFCAIPSVLFCPPNLPYGNSYPHTGDGMIGFGPYSAITGRGESVGIKLSTALVKDSAYCFGFWIKNSRHDNIIYSLKQFDVAFVVDTLNIDSKADISSFTIINNNTEIDGWYYLSGAYIAKGMENYFLLGSFDQNPKYYFHPDSPPDKLFSYYYFDDFEVYPCNKDSLFSVVCELPNVLTINNDNKNELYELRLNNISKLDIQIFNRWGNTVRQYDGLNEVWDGSDSQGNPLTEGVYFVKAIAETTFGEVLSKQQFVHLIR